MQRPSLFLSAVLVAATVAALVSPAHAISSFPLRSVSFPDSGYAQPFATVSFSADANLVVLGVTIQVPVDDCDQSSRWTFRTPNLLSSNFNFTIDRRVCAVFIVAANPFSVTTVGTFTVEVRKLWYYNNRASAIASSAPPLRFAWNYWITQRFLVSDAATQHAFYCLPSASPFLAYFDAASTCNLWMQDPTDPTATGATLAAGSSALREWLLGHQRKTYSAVETDILTGQQIGYVTYMGLFGNRAQWDNGQSVKYTNWATSNPTGAFPTVLDQFGMWRSVIAQESHAYCCESSGIGGIQATQNGMISAVPVTTPASTTTVLRWTMDFTSPLQFPFEMVAFDAALTYSGLVHSFVAGIHQDDCDGSLRFLVDFAVLDALEVAGLVFRYDVQLCSIRLVPLNGSATVNVSTLLPFIRQLRVMNIAATDVTSVTVGEDLPGGAIRVVWGFTVGDNTSWVMGHFPQPHFYQCFFDSKTYDQADDACAELSGGLNEAYLLTPQTLWEQTLMARLHARVSFNDDVWFGVNRLRGANYFANGDALAYSNWANGQPTSAKQPAKASASDGRWFTVPLDTASSFCCEWNAVPSRGLTGAINITRTVLSFGIPHKETPIAYKAFQSLRVFRNLSSLVYPQLLDPAGRRVFGVTMQVTGLDCDAGRGYQLWAPVGAVPSGFSFCPSAASACNFQILREGCVWYLKTTNGSAVRPAAFLAIMHNLILNISKRIPHLAAVPVGWAFWANHTLTFGPIVTSVASGVQFACADPDVAVTFLGGMEQCRHWHGDGYLASVLSAEEQRLLDVARRIANGFTATSFGKNAWLGLDRNSSHWSNGDLNVYQKWATGQPDKTGPTQAGGTGAWTNVPHALQSSLPTASFCCKRNGFNQLTSLYGGTVIMRGPTYSITVSATQAVSGTRSRSRPTPTGDVTKTRSLVETRTVPLQSVGNTGSVSDSRQHTATRTRWMTTSVPQTTPPVTRSLSELDTVTHTATFGSGSAVATVTRTLTPRLTPTPKTTTPTITASIPLLPIALVNLVRPDLPLVFLPRDVRAGAMQLTFGAVFVLFVSPLVSSVFANGGVTLQLDPSSPTFNTTGYFFHFATVGGTFLPQSSFRVDPSGAFLTVQPHPMPAYDPIADEVLLLTIHRNVTTLPLGHPPDAFPPFRLRIVAESTEPTDVAKAFSWVLGALAIAAPAALRDQQIVYLLGRHHCAKPYMRKVFRSGLRVLSPAYWEDDYTSQWVGSAVVIGLALLINAALLGQAVSQTTVQTAGSVFARGLFPSVVVLGTMWMHVPLTFFSIRLVQTNLDAAERSMAALVLGGVGVGWCGLLTLSILVWSVLTAPDTKFEVYDDAALHQIHWAHRPFLPFGRWAVADSSGLFWIAGEYRFVQYAGAEWLFGWLFTWFISFRPDTAGECFTLFLALALTACLMTCIVAIARPFRSSFLNFCSCASFLCLSILLFLSAAQMNDPDGISRGAQLAFRWILVTLTVARSVGNASFLYLEAKLIAADLDSFERERWRQMHALKKNSIIFQSQYLKRALDAEEEMREQAKLDKRVASLRRFKSVAFGSDGGTPDSPTLLLPASRRDTVRIDPGYQFPTSFRKVDAEALVDEDFPDTAPSFRTDDEAFAPPAIPAKEYSFGGKRLCRLGGGASGTSSGKRFSMHFVDSGSDTTGDDSADDYYGDDMSDEASYDPFASVPRDAAQPRQGMYRNSMLYRQESLGVDAKPGSGSKAGTGGRAVSPASPQRRSFNLGAEPSPGGRMPGSPRGAARVSFRDPQAAKPERRPSSPASYDPFDDEGPLDRSGSSRRAGSASRGLQGSGQSSPSRGGPGHSRWDSTVHRMLQQRAASILELEDDDDL